MRQGGGHRLADVGIASDAQQQGVGAGDGFRDRGHSGGGPTYLRHVLSPVGRLFIGAVEAGHGMTGADEVSGHRAAHDA